MTPIQAEWYTFILPLTTIPAALIIAYFRYIVIPKWFKSLEK